MNARDVLDLFEPEFADARGKATQLTSGLSPLIGEAKRSYANADPDMRIVTGLLAGLVLGKVVSRLGR